MSERFETLYQLSPNLYSENSPIIVSACALLKDSQTDKVVTQFKFQSVSKERIHAVKITLNAFDVSKKPLGKVDEYQYLDLKIDNGAFFGQNKAIIMPYNIIRSIVIDNIIVVFENGTKAEIAGKTLTPINSFIKLDTVLDNCELIKQYQIDSSTKGLYVPQEADNLWICPCGTINSSDVCTFCNSSKKVVFSSYDAELLKEHMDLRLEQEAEEQKRQAELAKIKAKENEERLQKEREQKEQEEKQKKKNKIVYSIVAIVIAIILIVSYSVNSSTQKKNAITDIDTFITEQQYEHAFDRLNQSNLSYSHKQEYLDKLKPLMKTQKDMVKDSYSEVLNIDGLIVYLEDNSLYYIDENGEKNIIYKMADWEIEDDFYIDRDNFIYANGYILFNKKHRVEFSDGSHRYYDNIVRIQLNGNGIDWSIEIYCTFFRFYKLENGEIVIDLLNKEIIFNPYNNATTKEGNDLISEAEKDKAVYIVED